MSNGEPGTSSRVRAPIRTRWLALAVLLGLAIIGAGCYRYWVHWQQNRLNAYYRSHAYSNVQNGFLTDVKQGRWDSAYMATTPAFQQRVSRDDFDQRAGVLLNFHAKHDIRGVGGSVSGSIDRGYRSKQSVTKTYTLQDTEGNQLSVSTTVLIEDSILYSRPPLPLVDDFVVEYKASVAVAKMPLDAE